MNGLLKKYWYLLVLLFVLPIGLNFLLQANTLYDYEVIGDSKTWLSFWSTYFASILGSLITLFVLFRILIQNEASLLKTLSQNEAHLHKTLSQNEANNDESKKLQIAIFKKGLEERRIQELSMILRDSLNYIDFSKLSRKYIALMGDDFIEVKHFFDYETTRTINTITSLSLDFTTSNKDNKEAEFRALFTFILNKYMKLISMAVRIISLVEYSGLEYKIKLLKARYFEDIKSGVFFTKEEFEFITNTQSEEEFNKIIMTFFNVRYKAFGDIYRVEHPKLVSKAEEVISHKKEQLEKITI